jgi:hypothetical protein
MIGNFDCVRVAIEGTRVGRIEVDPVRLPHPQQLDRIFTNYLHLEPSAISAGSGNWSAAFGLVDHHIAVFEIMRRRKMDDVGDTVHGARVEGRAEPKYVAIDEEHAIHVPVDKTADYLAALSIVEDLIALR